MTTFRVLGIFVSVVLALVVAADDSTGMLTEPSGLNVFSYAARSTPIVSDDPAIAFPVGLGAAAEGGPTLSVLVALAETESVDLYFAVAVPGAEGELFLWTQAGTFLPLSSSGLVAWKRNFSGPVVCGAFRQHTRPRASGGQVYLFSGRHAVWPPGEYASVDDRADPAELQRGNQDHRSVRQECPWVGGRFSAAHPPRHARRAREGSRVSGGRRDHLNLRYDGRVRRAQRADEVGRSSWRA